MNGVEHNEVKTRETIWKHVNVQTDEGQEKDRERAGQEESREGHIQYSVYLHSNVFLQPCGDFGAMQVHIKTQNNTGMLTLVMFC